MPLRFSIITCTWNSEPYIAQSIASVLAQDHQNFEYIFVDGGSTDGTLERIEAIDREKIILTNVRGGVARAMNAGIEAATGDIIAHLHADDYYLNPTVLADVARLFESGNQAWIFGRAMSDMNDGRVLPESWAVPRYSYKRLLQGNFIPHQAAFIRRAMFSKIGTFDERYRYAMDYDFWLRLGAVAEPLQIDKHFVAFRRHSGSLTTANYAASMREDFRIRLRYASRSPAALAIHSLRYIVRRARLLRNTVASR